MQLQYDEQLVEGAVFLCSTGRRHGTPALQIRRFHAEREKLYAKIRPDDRNAAFFQLHLSWFREWGLEEALRRFLAEFKLLGRDLSTVVFRSARNRSEEGAELFVNGAARHAVIALRSERFCDDGSLGCFLRHEFTHLHDMLDPEFEYSPELSEQTLTAAHQKLTRERYRLLWDITIDGRLTAGGHTPMSGRERHWADFARAYGFWEPAKQEKVFDALWNDPAPRHGRLLEMASDPRGLRDVCVASPGALCSLCGFPTFQWSANTGASEQTCRIIREHFPHWTPEQGVCSRCFEIYGMIAQQQNLAVA